MADAIADILAQAENPAFIRVATARVLLRQDLIARHEQLDADLTRALKDDERENRIAVAPAFAAEVEALETEMEAAKVEFKFRSIGKKAWSDMLAKHPPTKQQRETMRGVDHNPMTFPAAAIAATCIEPQMTNEEVDRLERALTTTQFDLLWAKCVDANVGGL